MCLWLDGCFFLSITVRVLRLLLLLVAKQPMPRSYYTILSWRFSTYVIFAKVNWFSNPYYYYSRERREQCRSSLLSPPLFPHSLYVRILALFQIFCKNLISSLFYLQILFVFYLHIHKKYTKLTIGYIDWALSHIQLATI